LVNTIGLIFQILTQNLELLEILSMHEFAVETEKKLSASGLGTSTWKKWNEVATIFYDHFDAKLSKKYKKKRCELHKRLQGIWRVV